MTPATSRPGRTPRYGPQRAGQAPRFTGPRTFLQLPYVHVGELLDVRADSAGWHQSKELQRPANIHLELLPPYSPELNPTEHLWDYIREQKGFNNHVFDSMEELEAHLEAVLKNLQQEKDYIKSLCTFNWMINPP